jgi:hypothetical protein
MGKAILIIDGRKPCACCKRNRLASEFPPRPSSPSGLHSWCRDCYVEKRKQRKDRDPDWYRRYYSLPENAQKKRDQHKMWRYGVNGADLRRRLEKQGYRCKCCGDALSAENMHTDHDRRCCSGRRSCGKCIRGLLCGGCNIGLGMFRDDASRLQSAILYLQDWTNV